MHQDPGRLAAVQRGGDEGMAAFMQRDAAIEAITNLAVRAVGDAKLAADQLRGQGLASVAGLGAGGADGCVDRSGGLADAGNREDW